MTRETRPFSVVKMYQATGECSERRSHRDEMALVCVPVIADTGRRNRNRNIDSETRKVSYFLSQF